MDSFLFTSFVFLAVLQLGCSRTITKRQSGTSPKSGFYSPFQLPYGNSPYAVPNGFNPSAPFFPFTGAFDMGTGVGWGRNRANFRGDLNFLKIDKLNQVAYPKYVDGGFSAGQEGVDVRYGHTKNPKNKLDIPIGDFYPCLVNPALCTATPVLGVRQSDVVAPINSAPIVEPSFPQNQLFEQRILAAEQGIRARNQPNPAPTNQLPIVHHVQFNSPQPSPTPDVTRVIVTSKDKDIQLGSAPTISQAELAFALKKLN